MTMHVRAPKQMLSANDLLTDLSAHRRAFCFENQIGFTSCPIALTKVVDFSLVPGPTFNASWFFQEQVPASPPPIPLGRDQLHAI